LVSRVSVIQATGLLSFTLTRLTPAEQTSLSWTHNIATFIDFCFAMGAALCFYLHYFFIGALFVQLFGLWSCIDGELARLSGKSSTLGDFYDTMVDRSAEFIIVASLLLAFRALPPVAYWDLLMFAYMGAVFLITNSSEKFRSAYHQNYPKKRPSLYLAGFVPGAISDYFIFPSVRFGLRLQEALLSFHG